MSAEDTRRWTVYILKTATNRLYTGITRDVERRLTEHRAAAQWRSADASGKTALAKRGAKALRGQGPLTLLRQFEVLGQGPALRLEYRIKQLSRGDKEALVAGRLPIQSLLAEGDKAVGLASEVANKLEVEKA